MNCPACKAPTISRNRYEKMTRAARAGFKERRMADGTCVTCRRHALGIHEPSTKVPTETVLDEVEFALEGGTRDPARLAEWAGVSREAMMLTLRRAARAGNQRAIDIRAQIPTIGRTLAS